MLYQPSPMMSQEGVTNRTMQSALGKDKLLKNQQKIAKPNQIQVPNKKVAERGQEEFNPMRIKFAKNKHRSMPVSFRESVVSARASAENIPMSESPPISVK